MHNSVFRCICWFLLCDILCVDLDVCLLCGVTQLNSSGTDCDAIRLEEEA